MPLCVSLKDLGGEQGEDKGCVVYLRTITKHQYVATLNENDIIIIIFSIF